MTTAFIFFSGIISRWQICEPFFHFHFPSIFHHFDYFSFWWKKLSGCKKDDTALISICFWIQMSNKSQLKPKVNILLFWIAILLIAYYLLELHIRFGTLVFAVLSCDWIIYARTLGTKTLQHFCTLLFGNRNLFRSSCAFFAPFLRIYIHVSFAFDFGYSSSQKRFHGFER